MDPPAVESNRQTGGAPRTQDGGGKPLSRTPCLPAAFKAAAVLVVVLVFCRASALAAAPLEFAPLGDFPLENGGHIIDCTVAYRTYGTLNAERSNAVLMLTWFGGRSDHLEGHIGTDRYVDSERYFVIAVDAFANGHSSSPSNSTAQPDDAFPEFSVRDLVEAQHRLLTEHLRIDRLHAVIGTSMGGMQALQWLVSYPDFMRKAVAVAATPQLTSYDLLLWRLQQEALRTAIEGNGDAAAAMRLAGGLHLRALTTPEDLNARWDCAGFETEFRSRTESYANRHPHDWDRQLSAMMRHDIYESFAGDIAETAAAVSAEVLVVISGRDHMVHPGPARDFARHLGCVLVELHNDGGHLAADREAFLVRSVVRAFLDNETP